MKLEWARIDSAYYKATVGGDRAYLCIKSGHRAKLGRPAWKAYVSENGARREIWGHAGLRVAKIACQEYEEAKKASAQAED
ncbi:MAG: hypothetical protein FWG40_01240 [Peptococcaceae bacterium]|nr:hypothetical protein [Peptococcaceae bacterium]